MKKQRKSALLLFILIFLPACSAQRSQDENLVLTIVAGTQESAALQTESAMRSARETAEPVVLLPTITLEATATTYIYIRDTATPTPSLTPTPRMVTVWPDWKKGNVIKSSGGGGGTFKEFSDLVGLEVIVIRPNGVKLRSIPSKAIGGEIEESGSVFTLTGIMNKNPQYDWIFAQVIAADGNKYWVGGTIGDGSAEPSASLLFYYPWLTPSPTPSNTPTGTPEPSS